MTTALRARWRDHHTPRRRSSAFLRYSATGTTETDIAANSMALESIF
jgi:hypothetical protein